MCTVIILKGVSPSHPIVVAGNRDEFLDRPALPPHTWTVQGENHRVGIFAGKDETEGGTWFGVNQYGLVVGVTNLYTGKRDPERSSRGQLVLKCLAAISAEGALGILTPGEVSRYNPFNLFCLSEQTGFVIIHDDQRSRRLPLDQGVHILTNRAADDPRDTKREWLYSHLGDLPGDPGATVERLSQLLASHGKRDPLTAACVHLPGYGTVSACMLFVARQRDQSRYLYAHGPPCETQFQDLTPDLLPLLAGDEQTNSVT
jgi:uncharacterized protein with NRDE domain